MSKIFIAGSITIKCIDPIVIERINNILQNQYDIIVGDADGVDKSIQEYLHQENYPKVIVYHSGAKPRNNIGCWPTKAVSTHHKVGTREFFTAKDIEMAKDAEIGVMLWDTKSTGTLKNVIELVSQHKKSTVFINKDKRFQRVYNIDELELLTQAMSEAAFKKANMKIKIFDRINQLKQQYIQPELI